MRQYGFRPGRSTTDQIFTIRQFFKKPREYGKGLFACFVDLETAKYRVRWDLKITQNLVPWDLETARDLDLEILKQQNLRPMVSATICVHFCYANNVQWSCIFVAKHCNIWFKIFENAQKDIF